MAKCKNCLKLFDCVEIRDGKDLEYKWCDVIDDCPDIECERSCLHFECMSNADRIRSMPDEELAEFFLKVNIAYAESCMTGKSDCVWEDYPTHDKGCKDCYLEWLKSEVGD